MAREVPRDQPLSDEDRDYMLSRGQEAQVAAIDAEHGGSADTAEVQAVTEPEEEETDYNSMTVADLQKELANRQLPTSGNKTELVARLQADDSGV